MNKFDPIDNKVKSGGSKLLVPNKDLVDASGTKIAGISVEDATLKAKAEIEKLKEFNTLVINEAKDNKIVKDYQLLGNTVVVRLFKHIPYNYKKEVYMYNPLVTPYQTEGGKIRTEESPIQFIRRGVVYQVSENTSEEFKSKVKVGTVVDLKLGINLQQKVFFPETEDLYFGTIQTIDGYFMVNEHDIEKIILKDCTEDYK